MVDPVTGGVAVAVATALAKPFDKLIEVCAAGAGRLYEPTSIRRRARAEGDALVIMEEAESRRSEVALRAAERLLDTEERRQKNIEAIVEQARLALPDAVSSEPVDTDWSTRFFREAQDIGNEEMQLLWGKLLAGEVTTPGSFSPRTLRVVADLTAAEAQLFESLCSLRFVALFSREPLLFFKDDSETLKSQGLVWAAMQSLVAAGLIHHHGVTDVQLNPAPGPHYFEAPGAILFVLSSPIPAKVSMGRVSLTPAGVEMCRLARWLWNADHVRDVVAMWKADGWTVEAKTIVGGGEPGEPLSSRRVEDREMPV